MRNVEFKSELREPDLAAAALKAAGARFVIRLRQLDTYYRVPTGKLKKREAWPVLAAPEPDQPLQLEEPEPVEYIRYERHERPNPKLSDFHIYTEAEFAERFGQTPPPVWVQVDKVRAVWMAGPVRVHLDEVKGLGRFLEFESLVTKEQNIARGHESVNTLRARLAPTLGEPVAAGYADLLAAETA